VHSSFTLLICLFLASALSLWSDQPARDAQAVHRWSSEQLEEVETIFRAASPDIAAQGILSLLSTGAYRDKKKVQSNLDFVRSAALSSTNSLPLRYAGGPGSSEDAVLGASYIIGTDRLSLLSRAAVVTQKLNSDAWVDIWRLALAVGSLTPAVDPPCSTHLIPNYEDFYRYAAQLLRSLPKPEKPQPNTRLTFVLEILETLNSFGALHAASDLLTSQTWSDAEKSELGLAFSRKLATLAREPRTFAYYSQGTHKAMVALSDHLAISDDLLESRNKLLASYLAAVRSELSHGTCGSSANLRQQQRNRPGLDPGLVHLIQDLNQTPGLESFSLDPKELIFQRAKSHPSLPPQPYELATPIHLIDCVKDMFQSHARKNQLTLASGPADSFEKCLSAVVGWRANFERQDRIRFYLAKSGKLSSLSLTALHLGNTLPSPQSSNTADQSAPATATAETWPIWQKALHEHASFLNSADALAVKGANRSLWLGDVYRSFSSFRGMESVHKVALWQSLQSFGNSDLLALATLYGLRQDTPAIPIQ